MSFARNTLLAAALALPPAGSVAAQGLAPHVAQYQVHLGTSPTSAPIGTATQRLTHDCQQWRLERDVAVDLTLAGSLRFKIESRLRGNESVRGDSFTYDLVRVRSDQRQQISGTVTSLGDAGGHAAIRYPGGPVGLDLPARTRMPVSGLRTTIDRLVQGVESFAVVTFDPETVGDGMVVDVSPLPATSVRARFAAAPKRAPAGGTAWPVSMSFTPVRSTSATPVYVVSAMMHNSGSLDRITVRSGILNLAADLVDYEPIDTPHCPRT